MNEEEVGKDQNCGGGNKNETNENENNKNETNEIVEEKKIKRERERGK